MNKEVDLLKQLVAKHRAFYEVWPEYLVRPDGKRVQMGFEIDLLGVHEHPERPSALACEECARVYEDLKKIAEWIAPREHGESRYEIKGFEPVLRIDAKRKFREEVEVSIKVLHREGLDRPLDPSQTAYLHEIEKKLLELRFPKGR